MIDFATLQGLTIPEGVVTQITDASGRVLWMLNVSGPIVLQVEKITSDTYAGETTYTGEQFILLNIYPKTNGTVSVTYGGLTKTITDTSGAEEPNAQQVYFGTFNGVSDSVETPASGTLTIEGDARGFGNGDYVSSSKNSVSTCRCITAVDSVGKIELIPMRAFIGCDGLTSIKLPSSIISIGAEAFYSCTALISVELPSKLETIDKIAFYNTSLVTVEIPSSVTTIGHSAFFCCTATSATATTLKTVKMLGTTPPELGSAINSSTGALVQTNFGDISAEDCALEKIIVPNGCGDTYKTATGWSHYADYITEAT